jgi:TetR/AcrR family transcriptional repressor of nem operon
MKVSKEQAAEHHRAILHAAATLFRARGFDGTKVTDIMAEAKLTHGAFYGHFRSKSELAASACQQAFEDRLDAWGPDISLPEYLDRYITPFHRDRPGQGCPIAAFATDIARQEKPVQMQFQIGVSLFRKRISMELAAAGKHSTESNAKASTILSTMVGAIVLARSTIDRSLSARLLKETRSTITKQFAI